MMLFKERFSLLCIALSLFGGIAQAKAYDSKWFSINFPDDWTLYDPSKDADNDGVGARCGCKDKLMGFEAHSSWNITLNVPFLRQTLDQHDSQEKIKKFVLKRIRRYFEKAQFTRFAAITIDDEPGVEVQWNATLTKKCRLPLPLGQRAYFSLCLIPSYFNWGNYALVGYSTQWNEKIQDKMSSISNTFRRCKDEQPS